MGFHGNLYDLKNGWYQAYLYNVLPNESEGITLDGHYTILFNKQFDLRVYKHGDYAGLTSIEPVEFKGFLSLNEHETAYFKERAESVMKYKLPYNDPKRKYASEAIFDYDFDLHGIPVYFNSL